MFDIFRAFPALALTAGRDSETTFLSVAEGVNSFLNKLVCSFKKPIIPNKSKFQNYVKKLPACTKTQQITRLYCGNLP